MLSNSELFPNSHSLCTVTKNKNGSLARQKFNKNCYEPWKMLRLLRTYCQLWLRKQYSSRTLFVFNLKTFFEFEQQENF